jgi:Fe-S cluster assembly protein SufD
MKDESEAVFQGLIEVNHEARGTDAYLTNNNLILNDGAKADSIPSLNIKTDDVKCSHGSTTGRIDEEQIYYLQCRGFTREGGRGNAHHRFFRGPASQSSGQHAG